MRKGKLQAAKLPLPAFQSDKTAAEYFDTHSIAEVWDQLAETKPPRLAKGLERTVRLRGAVKSPGR